MPRFPRETVNVRQFWTCTSCHNVQHPVAMCIINSYRTRRFQVRVEQVHLLSSLHHLVHITASLSIPYQILDQWFITLHLIWKSELPVIQVSMPIWGLILINSPVITTSPHFAATPDFGALRTTNKDWFRCFPFPRKLDRIIGCFAGQMSQMGGK
jgi:hypothetical protein